MKTSELIGPALDWAVAKCEGYTEYDPATEKMLPPRKEYGWVQLCELHYSTDWTQGGPIIEREGITLRTNACVAGHWAAFVDFGGSNNNVKARQSGPTPLIAAARCYVASKLGDEIDVPEDLNA